MDQVFLPLLMASVLATSNATASPTSPTATPTARATVEGQPATSTATPTQAAAPTDELRPRRTATPTTIPLVVEMISDSGRQAWRVFNPHGFQVAPAVMDHNRRTALSPTGIAAGSAGCVTSYPGLSPSTEIFGVLPESPVMTGRPISSVVLRSVISISQPGRDGRRSRMAVVTARMGEELQPGEFLGAVIESRTAQGALAGCRELWPDHQRGVVDVSATEGDRFGLPSGVTLGVSLVAWRD